MVEKQVLAIQRETEILVELIANAHHKTLEVQWILPHVVVWHEPLKHSKAGQLGSGNMVMAQEVEPNLTRPSVVLKRLVDGGLRSKSSEEGVAWSSGRLCTGGITESGVRSNWRAGRG